MAEIPIRRLYELELLTYRSLPMSHELLNYTTNVATQAQAAARELACVDGQTKQAWLEQLAQDLLANKKAIQEANADDLEAGRTSGLASAMLDRLTLTAERIDSLAAAVLEIAALPDPIGEVIEGQRRPNGMLLQKIRVPLGVVFFIYESRPNVTVDAAALCVKSGNAVILRGGREAIHSNAALAHILTESLQKTGLPKSAAQLVNTADRDAVGHFLKMNDLIDVTIPRGGLSLIERVAREATMPVIKHFNGICHVYVDAAADPKMATDVVVNSKCQRPGVCNAAETVLIHQAVAATQLPVIAEALQGRGVELRCCERSRKLISDSRLATEQDFATEHLALVMSVRIVDDIQAAVAHIRQYGSAHTDAIVTSDLQAAATFEALVDSSAVMINASTRFNDGGEFGLGAEIGISTDRFHARGPCGLREITSYKYVVRGDGHIRS
jgi:glutamate-5-semialdehyde dehydrogenase